MKKLIFIGLLILFPFAIGGCSDDPSGPGGNVEEPTEQKQFIWNGLNFWYLWQQDVPQLRDDHFSDQNAFYTYLNNFSDAEALFNDLLYSGDRFSFFIEDYEVREKAQQGISKSFGFSFGLIRISNSSNVFGYVQYVLPNTPAEAAGLKRGDLFTGINGNALTVDNYQDLLDNDQYVLTMADIANNTISETGSTITMDAVELQENPVYLTKVFDTGSVQIGYMVFNAFRFNNHEEMNDAFGQFINQGVDELVLDLRYNGGGAVTTCAVLASMISGIDSTNIFAKYVYNEKRSDLNDVVNFFSSLPIDDNEGGDIPMNKLSLNRVYILTGFGTASASEMLINGLKPYIDVVLIGGKTVAKDVGSITLYDSPPYYFTKDNLNPNHKIAMQPIVVRLYNSNDQNYPNGFTPPYLIEETDYLENLTPLGDENEPLLAKAIALITGQPQIKAQPDIQFHREAIADSRDFQPIGKEMYLLPNRRIGDIFSKP